MYIAREKGKNAVRAFITGKGSKKYGNKKETTYSR
jgi:hypothetical protein